MRAGGYRVWVCVDPSVSVISQFSAAANMGSFSLWMRHGQTRAFTELQQRAVQRLGRARARQIIP